MFEDVKTRIEEFLAPILEEHDLEIVDFTIHHHNRTVAVLMILDHYEGGITLDECSRVNKKVSLFIESESLFEGDYTIEVSSPGLDRPLKTHKDFTRVKGRMVKFHLSKIVENKLEHDGVVSEVTADGVTIHTHVKELVIPLAIIQKAVQII
ncbi:MAG TPA: ribosome maturation factor RimP [Candidatus Omnitrophota bacterium]|nr:ribosome maturation factor RimP [Candidatus Omnitrophota bacterium]